MDRDHAIDILPHTHAVILRLRDQGADDYTVAAAVDVDDRDIAILIAIAEAKLARLMPGTSA